MTLTRPIWASIATAPATIAGTMNPCTTAVAHCTPIPAAAAAVSQPVMPTHAETIPMSRRLFWSAMTGIEPQSQLIIIFATSWSFVSGVQQVTSRHMMSLTTIT